MLKYIVRRLIQTIPVMIGITVVTFLLMHLQPGNPTDKFLQNPKVTADMLASFEHRWGFSIRSGSSTSSGSGYGATRASSTSCPAAHGTSSASRCHAGR